MSNSDGVSNVEYDVDSRIPKMSSLNLPLQRAYYIYAQQVSIQDRIDNHATAIDAAIPISNIDQKEMTLPAFHRTLNSFQLYAIGATKSISSFESAKKQHGPVSMADCKRIFDIADVSQNGSLSFSEFYNVYACLTILSNISRKHLSPENVRKALQRVGLNATEGSVNRLFTLGDLYRTHDKVKIDLGEFLELYLSADVDIPVEKHNVHVWQESGRNAIPYNMPLSLSPAQNAIAANVAGFVNTLVGHPFDTAKVRLQLDLKYAGLVDCARQSIKREGPLFWFKGLTPVIFSMPMVNAAVFPAYSWAKEWFHSKHEQHRPLNLLEITLSGCFAGFLSSFVISPVELVRTRLQVQYMYHKSLQYTGPLHCITRTMNRRGIPGLYTGLSATLSREVVGYGGQFFLYEFLKRRFQTLENSKKVGDDMPVWQTLVSGGLAGTFGWALCYPVDFIKTQLQAAPTLFKWRQNHLLWDGGFFDCLKQTVAQRGYTGLYRGALPCLLRAFPANATGYYAYEGMIKFLQTYDE